MTQEQDKRVQGIKAGDRITSRIKWADGNGYTTTYQVVNRDGELAATNGVRITHYTTLPDRQSRAIDVPLAGLRTEMFEVAV